MKTFLTEHFIFTYQGIDVEIAKSLSEISESKFCNLCQLFQFSLENLDTPYKIVICKDVEEYIDVTGKTRESYENWMVGNANIKSKQITLLSPRLVKHSYDYMVKVFIHELIHLIFDDYCNVSGNEIWLSEGIALLFANQIEGEFDLDDYPKIEEISANTFYGEDIKSFLDNRGYDYAGIYVNYFIKLFGFNLFLDAYQNKININDLIYDGFELDAIKDYKQNNTKLL